MPIELGSVRVNCCRCGASIASEQRKARRVLADAEALCHRRRRCVAIIRMALEADTIQIAPAGV